MKLIDEYEEVFKKNMIDENGDYFDLINKSYKISGNIFAHFWRNKILESIDKKSLDVL